MKNRTNHINATKPTGSTEAGKHSLSRYFDAFHTIEGPSPQQVESMLTRTGSAGIEGIGASGSAVGIGSALGVAGLAAAVIAGMVFLLHNPEEKMKEREGGNEKKPYRSAPIITEPEEKQSSIEETAALPEERTTEETFPIIERAPALKKSSRLDTLPVEVQLRWEPRVRNRFASTADKPDYSSYTVINPQGLNSAGLDYAPTITPNGKRLYFVSNRPGGAGGHDIWTAYKEDPLSVEFSLPENIGEPINTSGNEGMMQFSPDGSRLYFTLCNRADGLGDCDIYESEFDGSAWGNIRNVRELNSSAWDSQPSLSTSGDTIYFVSNRPGALGGEGDADIYMAVKKREGSWSAPTNLREPINTPQREDSPFILPGGNRLYFSSAGHGGEGKLDFFVAERREDGTWKEPKNLGPIFNTPQDERMLTASADEKVFYFASERTTPANLGTLDIFMAVLTGVVSEVEVEEGKMSSFTTSDMPEQRISIVPNPATDVVTFKLPAVHSIEEEIVIINRAGEEAMRLPISAAEGPISISDLPNGLYFVRCGSVTGTFQVQR